MHANPPRRRRALAVVASVIGHVLALWVFMLAGWRPPSPPLESRALTVTLVTLPKPAPHPPPLPTAKPGGGAKAQAPRKPEAKAMAVRTPVEVASAKPARPSPIKARQPRPQLILKTVKPLPAASAPKPSEAPSVSEAQLASAATADSEGAGSGAGGGFGSGTGSGAGAGTGLGACNMVRRIQTAIRRSASLRAAVDQASRGRAMLIWNGDWVQSSGEDGRGLAGIRQAIMVEVAFAPEECRRQPVRGLVLLSMRDGPGASRLVMGQGHWRWSDLLYARGASPARSYSN